MTELAHCTDCNTPTLAAFLIDTTDGVICEVCDAERTRKAIPPSMLGTWLAVAAAWALTLGAMGCTFRHHSGTRTTTAAQTTEVLHLGTDWAGLLPAMIAIGLVIWVLVQARRATPVGALARSGRVLAMALGGVALLLAMWKTWDSRPHTVTTVTTHSEFSGFDGQPL